MKNCALLFQTRTVRSMRQAFWPTFLSLFLGNLAHAATIESAATGNWGTGATWVGGVVPGAGDDVTIKNGHTVALSDSRSSNTLLLEPGATFTLNGSLTNVTSFQNLGTVEWTGGYFSGTGTIVNDGIINITTNGSHNTSSDITNNGTINWTEGYWDEADQGKSLINTASGIVNFNAIEEDCYLTINNFGLVHKTSNGITNLYSEFNNEPGGSLVVSDGYLIGYGFEPFVQNGSITVDGYLGLEASQVTILAPGNFGGLGELELIGAVDISTAWHPTVATITQSANLTGTGSLTIDAATTWSWYATDFTMDGTVTNYGTLNIVGNDPHHTTTNIINHGEVNWPEADISGLSVTGEFHNESDGIFNLLMTADFYYWNLPFHNFGQIKCLNLQNAIFSQLYLEGGSISETHSIQINQLDWTGGDITCSGTVTFNSFTFSGSNSLSTGTLQSNANNGGTVDWAAGAELTLNSNAHFILAGTAADKPENKGRPMSEVANAHSRYAYFMMVGAGGILSGTSGGGDFTISGSQGNAQFIKDGTGTFSIDVPTTSDGNIYVLSGTLDINSSLENNGYLLGTATIDLSDATVTKTGFIQPGNGPDIPSSLTVIGDLTFATGDGIYSVFDATSGDVLFQHLIVEGDVTVTGGGMFIIPYSALPVGSWEFVTADNLTGGYDFDTYQQPACSSILADATSLTLTTAGTDKTWTGGTGFWSDEAKWLPYGSPCGLDNFIIPDGADVTCNAATAFNTGLVENGGTLTFDGGIDVTNGGLLTIDGTVNWLAANLIGGGAITNNGTLILGGGPTHVAECDITNHSIIHWEEGTFSPLTARTMTNADDGTFLLPTDLVAFFYFDVVNMGLITTNGQPVFSNLDMTEGLLNGTGSLRPVLGGSLNWSGGEISCYVNVVGGSVLVTDSPVLSGSLTVDNGTSGSFDNASLTIKNNGTLNLGTISVNPQLDGGSGHEVVGGQERKTAAITFHATSPCGFVAGPGGGNVNIVTEVKKDGTATFTAGGGLNINGGTLNVSEGTVDVNADFSNSGTVKGNGTLDLTNAINPTNSGNFEPGQSPGKLTVVGNYTNSNLLIEIEEISGMTHNDTLAVTGTATLGGSLNLTILGGSPALGNYAFLTAASVVGTFDAVSLPDCYSIIYTANSVILTNLSTTKTWDGSNANWGDAIHWTPVGVPCIGDTVIIPSGECTINVPPVAAAIFLNGGELNNDGGNYSIDAPLYIANATFFNIAASSTMDINGDIINDGTIEGYGMIDIEDATFIGGDGRWAPGNSAGKLTCMGTHTNEVVAIEIGGNNGLVEWDKLDVTDEMTTEGTLNLFYLGGTVPIGTRTIMECFGGANCRTGTAFSTITYPPECGASGCTVIYEPTRVRLQNTIPLESMGPCNWLGGDGDWQDQGKWSCNDIPNDNDDVTILSGDVTLQAAATAKSLVMGGGNLLGNFGLSVSGAFQWNGGLLANAATNAVSQLLVNGTQTVTSGTLQVDDSGSIANGSIILGGGATLAVSSGATLTTSTATNAGILSTGSSNFFQNLGLLTKTGGGTFSIEAPFVSSGTTDLQGGTLKLKSVFNNLGGTIKGTGTLDLQQAAIVKTGTISPGNSPGTIQILGDLTSQPTSVLDFEIEENSGIVSHDLVEIGGSAALGGTLNVSFLGGTIPAGSYPILTSTGQPTGAFSSINYLPNCPGECSIVPTASGLSFVLANPLPVELLFFKGKLEGKTVLLDWATAIEASADGFDVERSGDGENWSAIASLAGHSPSTERHDYSFTDGLPAVGTNFYRLKMKGRDGSGEFSEVVAIEFGVDFGWKIFPNPAENVVTVEFPATTVGELRLFNWAGREVLSQHFAGRAASVDLSLLPPGAYWLEARPGDGKVLLVK